MDVERAAGVMAASALVVALWLGPGVAGAAGLPPLSPERASRVERLLGEMTLEELVGQTNLLTSDWDVTGPSMRPGYLEDVAGGRVGALFNAYTAGFTRELQEKAVSGSRLGIPLLFGYDVIHGHRTVFPIPLAEAASWDLEAIERAARVAAREATAEGLHWTFAPMVDVARDPRWGRIAEGSGEDPWLSARIAEARVRGFQGDDLSAPDTLLACAKHFAAYGAAQAGRDYHTVDISTQTLHEVYLPPFRAALDAGVATFMTAFNEVDGVPATGHRGLLTDLLKQRWGFRGFVVTDYTSINEMVPHGFAVDDADAGRLAIRAGVDMDMQGSVFQRFLAGQVKAGAVPRGRVEDAARRVLEMKARLGLLEDPYRYSDPEREARLVGHPDHLAEARLMARKSLVLLENRGSVLPLAAGLERLAVVGPLAASRRDLIGSWSAAGDHDGADSLLEVLQARLGERVRIRHQAGCQVTGDSREGFGAAVEAARRSQLVLAVCGESWDMSGEAASRSRITLPGVQRELLRELEATGTPVVLVVLGGRPLDLSWEAENLDGLLLAWFPGTMGAAGVVDVLTGAAAPEGRLPVTLPRSLGQVPLFHAMKNTGRPVDPASPGEKYRSRYLDSPNTPLYPFGFGRTYTSFAYRGLRVSPSRLEASGRVRVSVTIENTGTRAGTEVVQLYLRDLVGSVTRPVLQLAGFQRVRLAPGTARRVSFQLGPEDLAYPRGSGDPRPEPGEFEVQVGPHAGEGLAGRFRLLE